MKNGGYSAFNSSDVLISEQGFSFSLFSFPPFLARGRAFESSHLPLSFIFSGIGGGRFLTSPHAIIMFWNYMTNGSIVQKGGVLEKLLRK